MPAASLTERKSYPVAMRRFNLNLRALAFIERNEFVLGSMAE